MRRFLLGIALALLAGCRKESSPPPVPKIEATAAERPSSDTLPKGKLAFKLPCAKDSAVAFYNDTAGDDADYVRFERQDSVFSDSGYFLERTFYEGRDWLYLSKRSCAELILYGKAIFNPMRTRFASISEDLDDGFVANGVQMVSLETGIPQVKLEDKMDGFGPRSGAWKDDSTFVADLEGGDGHDRVRTYSLRAGTWSSRDEVGKGWADKAALKASPADAPPYPEVGNDSALSR